MTWSQTERVSPDYRVRASGQWEFSGCGLYSFGLSGCCGSVHRRGSSSSLSRRPTRVDPVQVYAKRHSGTKARAEEGDHTMWLFQARGKFEPDEEQEKTASMQIRRRLEAAVDERVGRTGRNDAAPRWLE